MTEENLNPNVGPFPGICGPHTEAAKAALKTGTHGDKITPVEMAAKIGRPCAPGEKGYGNVATAIKSVEDTAHVVWRWQRGLGYWLCLDDAGKTNEHGKELGKAKRRNKRGLRLGLAVDVTKLDPDKRQEHNLNMNLGGMLAVCTGAHFRKGLRQIEAPTTPTTQKLIELMTPPKASQ